jgi:hypothetical protein
MGDKVTDRYIKEVEMVVLEVDLETDVFIRLGILAGKTGLSIDTLIGHMITDHIIREALKEVR